ncbi:MAG: ABC transporter permease [Acidobacteriota bacterium]
MRAYRALLHLYPASFRREYGEEMCAIFARDRRGARGPLDRVMLWGGAIRDVLGNAVMVHGDILRQDLRYTARTLFRARGFTLTAVAVVALGVGANTAAFSITDFVLLRPLPFPQADRLVKLWESERGYSRTELSPANYRDWTAATQSFDRLGAYTLTSLNLVGPDEPQRLQGADVTSDLLPTLGVQPALGRLFTAADEREGAPGTLLLSDRFWKNGFGGSDSILGRRVLLDDEPFVVIGVMAPDFQFPNRTVEFWRPLRFSADDYLDRSNTYLYGLGRLRPGVSLSAAQAEMTLVAAQLAQQHPKENENIGATLIALGDEVSRQSRLLLLTLTGAALCVLLIACANLANLLLARALGRRRELAVRAAIGAGRERLVRQLATESLTVSLLGGACGILLAVTVVPLLGTLVPQTLPVAHGPSVDLRVLAFAGLLTVATGLAFGLVPVLRIGGDASLGGLRDGARAGGGRKERLRSALVVGEVIASVVLLVASALLMRALWTVQARDPGFKPEGVITLRTALPLPKYDATARRQGFYSAVLADVRTLPGVSNAAYISGLPMVMRGGIWAVTLDGVAEKTANSQKVGLRFVTPGFFASLGIPVHAGRDVSESDKTDGEAVAVVSESFSKRYGTGQNLIGRRFTIAFAQRVIVGVVGDIRVRGLESDSEPQVYLPSTQVRDGWLTPYAPKDLVVRSSAPPDQLLPALRAIIRRADPTQPISDIRPLTGIVEMETASRAVQMRVVGAFAAIAFLLAGIGIHGVLSFAVSQRTSEIGVRVALGAQRRDILAMVLRQGVLLAAAGVIPGIGLAYLAARSMGALLVGVKPNDSTAFAVTAALSVVMTLAGCLMPTLRALRIDPVRAIRAE